MTDAPSFAAQRRRESQRQEWTEQTRLAEMLNEYLDSVDTFWTLLENKPLSRLSGIFQKKRGVRSGLPDVQVIWRGKPIFIELKSRAGVASKAQKRVRLEMLCQGSHWPWDRNGPSVTFRLMVSHASKICVGQMLTSELRYFFPAKSCSCKRPPRCRTSARRASNWRSS
jgi:hypothetical protein